MQAGGFETRPYRGEGGEGSKWRNGRGMPRPYEEVAGC